MFQKIKGVRKKSIIFIILFLFLLCFVTIWVNYSNKSDCIVHTYYHDEVEAVTSTFPNSELISVENIDGKEEHTYTNGFFTFKSTQSVLRTGGSYLDSKKDRVVSVTNLRSNTATDYLGALFLYLKDDIDLLAEKYDIILLDSQNYRDKNIYLELYNLANENPNSTIVVYSLPTHISSENYSAFSTLKFSFYFNSDLQYKNACDFIFEMCNLFVDFVPEVVRYFFIGISWTFNDKESLLSMSEGKFVSPFYHIDFGFYNSFFSELENHVNIIFENLSGHSI